MGPSRKILHVRGVGRNAGNRSSGFPAVGSPWGRPEKSLYAPGGLSFGRSRDPPFWIAVCGLLLLFSNLGFSRKLTLCHKIWKYTIYSFAFWSPKRAPKYLQIDGISSLFLNWKTPKNRNRRYNPSLFGRANEVQNNSKSIEFLRYFKLSNTKN